MSQKMHSNEPYQTRTVSAIQGGSKTATPTSQTRERVGENLENYNTVKVRVEGINFTFHYPKADGSTEKKDGGDHQPGLTGKP